MMSEMMSSVDNSIQDMSGISQNVAGKKYIKKNFKASALSQNKDENGAPEIVQAEVERDADMDQFIEDQKSLLEQLDYVI